MKRPASLLAKSLTPEEVSLLAAVFGAGQLLYVPSTTANAAHLEVILGLPATSNLVNNMGGNFVYLPGCKRPTGHAREPSLKMVKVLSLTASARTIARQFHCSVRTIYDKRREIRRREALGIPLTVMGNDARYWRLRKSRHKAPAHKNAREKCNGRRNRLNGHRSAIEAMTDD